MLTIPTIEAAPTFGGQAVPDSSDWSALVAALGNSGVVTGCAVSPQGTPNMTVAVGSGTVQVAGASVTVAAVASLTIAAASATDRRDAVVVNNAGTVSVVQGTPCSTAGWTPSATTLPPVKPAIPASSVLLAEIYVAASTTSVAAANLIDKRVPPAVAVAGQQLVTAGGTVLDDGSGNMTVKGASLKVGGRVETASGTNLYVGSGGGGAALYLRPTSTSANYQLGVLGASGILTYSATGAVQNTLDDGTGKMTAKGEITATAGLLLGSTAPTAGPSVSSADGLNLSVAANVSAIFLRPNGPSSMNGAMSLSTSGELATYNGTGTVRNILDDGTGALQTVGAVKIGSRPAFVSGDKYLVVDASGNVHVSSLGPAS